MGWFSWKDEPRPATPPARKPQARPVQQTSRTAPPPASGQTNVTAMVARRPQQRTTEPTRTEPTPSRPKLRQAEDVISFSDQLPKMESTLYAEFELKDSIRSRICPFELPGPPANGGRAKFAFVLLEEMLSSDILEELVSKLMYKRDPAEPALYVASPAVLRDLYLQKIDVKATQRIGSQKQSGSERGLLWNMFEGAATFAFDNEASDLHIEVHTLKERSQIAFRIDGKLVRPPLYSMRTADLTDMVAFLFNTQSNHGSENSFSPGQMQQCQITATISRHPVMFRWASFPCERGFDVVLRMLVQGEDQKIRSLEELGYLPDQIDMWKRSLATLGGGTLLSGVVGSGKSTTIQTLMAGLPSDMKKYSFEEPVEYIKPGVTQVAGSRSLAGRSEDGEGSFLAFKRQIKRGDLDVCEIAELRDRETAELFWDIAQSGHRAMASVHAPSHIGIYSRLASAEMGIPREVLATPGFINVLAYQALLPLNCECKLDAPGHVPDSYLGDIERIFGIDRHSVKVKNPDGCEKCRRPDLPELNGARGRTVVAEMFQPDWQSNLFVREHKNQELVDYVRSKRKAPFNSPETLGKTALEVAMYKVSRGLIDPREVEIKFGDFLSYEAERTRNSGVGKTSC